jgi:hypothetical protein
MTTQLKKVLEEWEKGEEDSHGKRGFTYRSIPIKENEYIITLYIKAIFTGLGIKSTPIESIRKCITYGQGENTDGHSIEGDIKNIQREFVFISADFQNKVANFMDSI